MHPRILPFAIVATALTGLATAPALAREYSTPLHRCVNAALAKKPGRVHEVELETKDGKEVYEIDIVGKDGKRWELLCDVETIAIVKVELEQEDDDSDHGYPAKAKTQAAPGPGIDVITPQPIYKVSEDKAKQIALGQYPGTISEVVYEYSNGRPGYEVHIRGNQGQRIEVEIDGITGNVTEVSEKTR